MPSYSVNERGVAHARRLINARQYVLNSNWGEVQPGAKQGNAFLASHSWDEYASWHLGLTDGPPDETKARYAFVYGDFIARDSSPVTIGPPSGVTRRSSWRLTTCCSCSTKRAPEPPASRLPR
jgi:hypothetical protein